MEVKNLFITPIFSDFLNFDLKEMQDYAYRISSQSNGREKSNRLGWQSNDVQMDDDLAEFISVMNGKLAEIHEYCQFKKNTKLVVDNLWVNINSKYSYNTHHIHNGSFYSGSFYIKVPEKSGNINFNNPSIAQQLFIQSYNPLLATVNEFTASGWTYQPKENMLILFPSWIEHYVEQNLSNSDRISIAFNSRLISNK